jgi:ATP-dependent DNA helicase RecG
MEVTVRAARVLSAVASVQRLQSETDEIETKAAGRGTPQRLYESLSAFANRPGGGLILLGIDEQRGFEVTGVGDAQQAQEDVSCVASDQMEPPLRPEFTVVDVDGKAVVAVSIRETPYCTSRATTSLPVSRVVRTSG